MVHETPAKVGLKAEGIEKYFSGVPALSGVSLTLRPGEIVGLIGHNGAGKSTLLKTLSGAHRHDRGRLFVDGKEVSFSSPADAIKCGVSTVYQELSLLPNLSITKNTWLGRELKDYRGLRSKSMSKKTKTIMDRFGLDVDVESKAGQYPVAMRQMIEIAIASTKNTRYLLLDEPTTALEGEQVERLLKYIRKLASDSGIGILLIDHKLDELYEVCDRIVALVDGKVILDGPVSVVTHDKVIQAIVGKGEVESTDSRTSTARKEREFGDVACSFSGLKGDLIQNVSFKARAGEIVGLYGLVGSGRTEFLRSLIGVEKLTAGTIMFGGRNYVPRNPRHATVSGIAYLTEERKQDGIVPQMDSIRNAALPVLRKFSKMGFLNISAMEKASRSVLESLHIRGNANNPVSSLSGGNQQKVLLARAIMQDPKLLLLDEPTKGVDIGVKAELHRLLRKMAKEKNLCVIVASSEEEEILSVSDSVVVFKHGYANEGKIPVGSLNVPKLRELAWS
ncbi:sugar ABC transporter ATP-binding protein [Corynebacterium glucuronolyticum]|uniref:sugar ABC transporter ATP-binding protein n=1 Tax=Corynebacterium glucuronolyticum TaxID=39791 RepID=UPI00223B8C0C|nr:sugar ABC transporter ATP-binding protein [Corynebacterium glucuronolyticum]MCT1443287.1 sugar ABC transporter ATP-binding protein [Corynebacterium glucuronolyticum]